MATLLPNSKIVFFGDSITYGERQIVPERFSYWQPLAADLTLSFQRPFPPKARISPSLSVDKLRLPNTTVWDHGGPGYVNTGVPGESWTNLGANLALLENRVFRHAPHLVIVEFGVNDVTSQVELGVVHAAIDSVTAALTTADNYPGRRVPQILMLSIFCWGEKWNTGPVWDNGVFPVGDDARVDQVCGFMRSAAAARGCEYVDVRGGLLAWEAANNPTKAGNGLLTTDGRHVTRLGARTISDLIRPSIQVMVPAPAA